MNSFVRVFAHFVCLVLFLSSLPAQARPLEDQKWIEVRSQNFTVRSVLKKDATVELTQHLEMVRAAMPILIPGIKTESSIRTDIYFLRASDFAMLGASPRKFAGLFQAGLRRNVVLIRDTKGVRETDIVLHEYVHFLTRNQGGLRYPMWFNEGMAEYIGASSFKRGFLEIGGIPESRRWSLGNLAWIPMADLLSPDDYDKWPRNRQAMFYAEAWALVHYLHNREADNDRLGENLHSYRKLLDSGTKDPEAFETAFGISITSLNRAVGRYLEAGRFKGFKIPAESLLQDFDPQVDRLSRSQASLALAKLAFIGGERDLAEKWFTIADGDPDTRAQAQAGLGDVRKYRGDFEAAEAYFLQALELAPDDPYCQLDAAEFWHYRAQQTEDPVQQVAYLEQARKYYIAAWKLDDGMPETYAMYGETFLNGATPDFAKAIEMLEEAQYLLPSALGIRLNLAIAYAGAGRDAEARVAAQSVLAWSHEDSGMAERAEEILSQLSAAAN
ncbi:MAG: hypothetical protein ACR2QB_00335 [Gammaproteobacteria bacterium]